MRMATQHITRCEKEFEAFNGWRFCITRQKQRLVRYFSDIEYGSKQNARAEAEAFREHIYTRLAQNPDNEAEILREEDAQYRSLSSRAASLRRHVAGTATMNLGINGQEGNTLTLIEEYHHGSSVEYTTHTLKRTERGSFTLELATRYDGVVEYALYRIPYRDGEYRFTLTFGK